MRQGVTQNPSQDGHGIPPVTFAFQSARPLGIYAQYLPEKRHSPGDPSRHQRVNHNEISGIIQEWAIADELRQLVPKVQQRLREGRYQNESDVREAIVVPILQALGWDTNDPGMVRREFTIQQARVDYALFVEGTEPSLLIEVKAVGSTREGDQQLFQYLYHQGTPMAVLTDGQEWGFYLPTASGSYEDRRVQKLDLLARDAEVCCSIFQRYLGYLRVSSGQALKDAQQDHQDNKLRDKARATLPEAWKALVAEHDDQLVGLLADKAENLCGSRPDEEDVAAFLSSLRGGPPPPTPVARPPGQTASPSPGSHNIEIVLAGKRETVSTAIDGLARIIEYLAKQDPAFLQRLATRAKGTKVNYLAKRREDVYPRRPDRQGMTRNIEGWYLATNISNAVKQTILRRVCEVARLRFGKDVALIVPD